jgi:hypothetical protein
MTSSASPNPDAARPGRLRKPVRLPTLHHDSSPGSSRLPLRRPCYPNEILLVVDIRALSFAPVTEHTGTIIRRGRFGFLKLWVVELDQAKLGSGIARIGSHGLVKLTPDDDPRRLRG